MFLKDFIYIYIYILMDSLEMIQNFNSEEFIIKNFQEKYLKYFTSNRWTILCC